MLHKRAFEFNSTGGRVEIEVPENKLPVLDELYDALKESVAEIMETLDTPITTITGIGPTLGAYILSEIGDINRFSSAARLAAYAA